MWSYGQKSRSSVRDLRSRWNLAVVVLAVSTFFGCGALQATPRSFQSESNGLYANSPGLNFGSAVVGTRVQAYEYLSNPTRSTVTITGATSTTADFQVVSPSFPIDVQPGRG